uniref:SMC5-SMC6 complex localization factor 1 n=1 Tax=Mastacembelus armatus TaxID=205130 RepID=A0A7N8YQP8_9TELE
MDILFCLSGQGIFHFVYRQECMLYFPSLCLVDVSPVVLAELVLRVSSTRLKLVMADAIFRNLCCRNGFTLGDEPLSLKKMVCTWVIQSSLVKETGQEKENIPKGFNRVNAAGETLLHRACKRNQVETVLQILALPGTDVNVRDHAGWTPLHEACNHGSTACVEALLRHHPTPVLNSQVGGVSPLHDALLNGNMDIAKMLLEYSHCLNCPLWATVETLRCKMAASMKGDWLLRRFKRLIVKLRKCNDWYFLVNNTQHIYEYCVLFLLIDRSEYYTLNL